MATNREVERSPAEPHEAILARLSVLQNLTASERWPAADWPTEAAFNDARVFVQRLSSLRLPFPNLGLADDGEVNFLWDCDGIHVDLGFYGAGTFSYYAHGKDGQGFYDDDLPASEGLPKVLEELLCR